MMNRKGEEAPGWLWAAGILLLIGLILVIMDINMGDRFDLLPFAAFSQNLNSGFLGFEQVFDHDSFKFFNYIFGKVPNYLISILGDGQGDGGSNISAGIVIIGIWALMFLFFADIFKLFLGLGGPVVPWVASALLAIIGANLRMISILSVYVLSVFAAFGALAVLLTIGSVFVLFILFHFGSAGLRGKLILRRAQDDALRAVAGGKRAAGGIGVLAEIVEAATKAKKP